MSQIASFYLLKDGQRQELSGGDCSGAVYMAIWDWCESELDLDVRFPAPQTEDTLDCALLEGELASQLLAALRGGTSRNWPLTLPRTGTCPPGRCKADWKRCAPTWSWCRATLPCCMNDIDRKEKNLWDLTSTPEH